MERNNPAILVVTSLLFVIAVVALLVLPGWKRGRPSYVSYLPLSLTARAAEVNPWIQAVEKVKEYRGEPAGKQANVEIPSELRHYGDTRRFLAIQVAEVREHDIETPQDFVDLAAMIKRGELVALQAVTENYILFGVGGNADKEPFRRYENGKGISLYNEAGIGREYVRIAEARAKFETEIANLEKELSSAGKRERSKRAKLQAQIVETEKTLKVEREDKELLDHYYDNAQKRRKLFSDYESLQSIAPSLTVGLPPRSFDIEDACARRDMKVRMLSFLRPEAVKVLEEIAVSYREKFQRPLPITSLVRPDEYQHVLSKTNPNATRIETPPHSTGLAFDILYRYMTAAEQMHLMAHLARLKDEGRIEVLRENRDHYHVFAFVDGAKPDEALIAASLGKTTMPKAAKETHHSERVSNKVKKKSANNKVPNAKRKGLNAKSKRRR